MTKRSSYRTIVSDLDAQQGYLLRRCLKAEGKDPDDVDAMLALIGDVQEAAPNTRA